MRPAVRFLTLLLVFLAVIALGVAALVLGEADDSPGLQAVGVTLIVASVALALRTPAHPGGSIRTRPGTPNP